jgi:hypothetical protein
MATIISEYFRYKQGMATDLFRWVIYTEWVCVGKSKSGGGHLEHVVPLAYLRDESTRMFEHGLTVKEVAKFLKKNFKVVEITVKEADYLNSKESGLKYKMPRDWDGTDEFARLRYCKIEWEPVTVTNTD